MSQGKEENMFSIVLLAWTPDTDSHRDDCDFMLASYRYEFIETVELSMGLVRVWAQNFSCTFLEAFQLGQKMRRSFLRLNKAQKLGAVYIHTRCDMFRIYPAKQTAVSVDHIGLLALFSDAFGGIRDKPSKMYQKLRDMEII